MVAYGTYERFDYVTMKLPAWPVSWNTGRLLLRALGWLLVAVAGLVVGGCLLGALFGGVYLVATALLAYVGQALIVAGVFGGVALLMRLGEGVKRKG